MHDEWCLQRLYLIIKWWDRWGILCFVLWTVDLSVVSAKRNFSLIYWTYNRICVLDVNAYNDHSCTGIEPATLPSEERLKQNALAFRLRIHSTNQSNGKYVDRECKSAVTREKMINELEILEYQLYTYSSSSMKHKMIIWL